MDNVLPLVKERGEEGDVLRNIGLGGARHGTVGNSLIKGIKRNGHAEVFQVLLFVEEEVERDDGNASFFEVLSGEIGGHFAGENVIGVHGGTSVFVIDMRVYLVFGAYWLLAKTTLYFDCSAPSRAKNERQMYAVGLFNKVYAVCGGFVL